MLECRVQVKLKNGRTCFYYFKICGLRDWKFELKGAAQCIKIRMDSLGAKVIKDSLQIFFNERWIDVHQ